MLRDALLAKLTEAAAAQETARLTNEGPRSQLDRLEDEKASANEDRLGVRPRSCCAPYAPTLTCAQILPACLGRPRTSQLTCTLRAACQGAATCAAQGQPQRHQHRSASQRTTH